jgi:hypothetical protein
VCGAASSGSSSACRRAQGDVAVDRVLDRRAVQRRRFLGHVGHAPALREIDLALVGMQFVAQHAEQAGFAGAVGADQADLVAGVEGEVGVSSSGLVPRIRLTLENRIMGKL